MVGAPPIIVTLNEVGLPGGITPLVPEARREPREPLRPGDQMRVHVEDRPSGGLT